MKKKLFILIGLMFIICGCTAEVNLTVTPERINETIIINAYENQYYTKEQLPTAFRKYIPAFGNVVIVDTEPDQKELGVKYYTRTEQDLGNGYKFTYKYNFPFEEYKDSYSLKNAFKSYNVQKDKAEKQVLISTDNGGLLYFSNHPTLTEVKVNISTSYEVLEHNADSVNNDVYTWILKRDSNNKNIYLLMNEEENEIPQEDDKEDKDDKEEEKKEDDSAKKEYDSKFEEFMNEHPLLVTVCALLLFLIVVIIILKISKIKI